MEDTGSRDTIQQMAIGWGAGTVFDGWSATDRSAVWQWTHSGDDPECDFSAGDRWQHP